MNLDDKIAVLQAAKDGKTIQLRNTRHHPGYGHGFTNAPNWQDAQDTHNELSFNFRVFDYRVKPESILDVARENHFRINSVRAIACTAKALHDNSHSADKSWSDSWGNLNKEAFKVIYYGSGDVTVGCQTFKWGNIDKLGKEQGWW